MKPMIVTVAGRPRMRSSDGGRAMETQGKLSHQLRCPPGQRATQVPGSTRVADPPRRRLARQVLRMAGQGAQDYERTPDLPSTVTH